MKKLLLSAIVILGFTAVSFGQLSATANASALVVVPLKIVKGTDLNFGVIAPSGNVGSVMVSTSNVRTSPTGTIQLIGTVAATAAAFTVTGQGSYNYSITLPADGDVTLTTGGTSPSTMAVTGFNSNPASGPETLPTGGTQALSVGATIAVAPTQAPGSYSATFDVTVAYN